MQSRDQWSRFYTRKNMFIGRVMGNATATVKHPSMEGWKLLLVMALQADGRTIEGDPILVVDSLGPAEERLSLLPATASAPAKCWATKLRRSLVGIGNPRRMNPSTIEIERVVREILAQLAAAPKETKSDGGEKKSDGGRRAAESGGESTDNKQASTVTVAARVVTMREIADRLPTMRRLVVSREAIVTPAVRDELLRRGIELSRADAAKNQPAAVRLVLMTSGTDFDPTALAATLVREGFGVECSASDCLIAATESLAVDRVKNGQHAGRAFDCTCRGGLVFGESHWRRSRHRRRGCSGCGNGCPAGRRESAGGRSAGG